MKGYKRAENKRSIEEGLNARHEDRIAEEQALDAEIREQERVYEEMFAMDDFQNSRDHDPWFDDREDEHAVNPYYEDDYGFEFYYDSLLSISPQPERTRT